MARKSSLPKAPIVVAVDRISHEGRGIACQQEGKTVFIEGALPGEQVQASIVKGHRQFDEAIVCEVLQASPERVEPPCAYASLCGGCSLQHWQADAQILFKQSVLAEQFAHFGGITPASWLPPLRGPTTGYRRRARLGVRWVQKRQLLLVGFREKRTHFLADIQSCAVLVPALGQRIASLKALITELQAREQIPQIEVAEGDDAVALVFRHLQPLCEADIDALRRYGEQESLQIWLQPAGPDSVHRLWPECTPGSSAAQRLHYALPEFGVELAFHPMDFTQVNGAINRQMVRLALELLDVQPQHRVLDLFCGLGNFTLPLATLAREVIAVEGVAAMVVRGEENARHNHRDNARFFATDLATDFSGEVWAKGGFDRILLDPPRSGALEVVQNIARFAAGRIVYVSCNPATLARDAGELMARGYRLVSAGVMDMFPHTTHVESIAVFERRQ